jgi:hypothetical protein
VGTIRSRGLQVTFRDRYLSEQFQDTNNETRLMVGGLMHSPASGHERREVGPSASWWVFQPNQLLKT